MTYSKHKDIQAILEHAADELVEIESAYKSSLHDKSISTKLLIRIKSFLGDMRSALDYSANTIPTADGYFPVCSTAAEFANRTSTLDLRLRAALEKWQPYNGNEWLAWFSTVNNKSKHVTLVPQERRETRETRVTGAGGGMVSWGPGVTFGSGVSIMGVPIDPRTQLPVPNQLVKTEIVTWVDFTFDNSKAPSLPTGLSALPLLKTIMETVPQIIRDIEATS